MQIVNFDSDELFDELNPSAESESEEERDRRHIFGQDRKRRRRPRRNSHFLVGGDKVSLFSCFACLILPSVRHTAEKVLR